MAEAATFIWEGTNKQGKRKRSEGLSGLLPGHGKEAGFTGL